MSFQQQLIYLFSALGASNGFLLSSYFLFLKSDKRLSDYFLGGLLLMLSVRILKSVFLFFNPGLFQAFVQIGLSACLLIGPFLYLYVRSSLREDLHLRKTWYVYLLPFCLVLGWLAYSYPYTGPPNHWGPFVPYIYKVWLFGILAAGYQLRGVFGKLIRRGNLESQEIWLVNVFVGVALIYLAYETSSYTSYIVGALSFSFVFYLSILLWFYQRNQRSIAADPPLKYANSTLTDRAAQTHFERLQVLMETEKLFLDPGLKLEKLGAQLGLSSKDLSQAINQAAGENYSTFIARLRVREAKRLLTSPDYQHYKIAAIAYESGFNSLSSFNASFKTLTGFTPGAYRLGLKSSSTLPES